MFKVQIFNKEIVWSIHAHLSIAFHLQLVATDEQGQGLSSNCTIFIVIIDANDNPPEFLEDLYTFSVRENAPIRTVVGVVNATDSDSENTLLRYYIEPPGGADGRFYLNPESGNCDIYPYCFYQKIKKDFFKKYKIPNKVFSSFCLCHQF